MSNTNMQYQQTAPQGAQAVHSSQPSQGPYAYPQYQQAAPAPVQTVPNVYPTPVKQPSGWGKLWAALGLLLAVQFFQIAFIFLGFLSRSDDGMMTVAEIGGGIVALLFVLLLGGKKLATPSLEGMSETWRLLKWIILTDLVIAIIEVVGLFIDGNIELAKLWPLRVLMLLLMCAGVGLFEEATFRGLCFHGLLARMGVSRKGIIWAVVLSSLFFGLMHVDFIDVNWSDPSQVVQAILKVLQTGVFAFAAAVAVLKTGNLWPVIILHGANNFALLFVTNGLMNNSVTTQYVSEGTEGLMVIAIYMTLIFAYSPAFFAALRELKEYPVPDRGQFYRPHNYPAAYAAPAPTPMAQHVYTAPQHMAATQTYGTPLQATAQIQTTPQHVASTQTSAAPQQAATPQAQPPSAPPGPSSQ